MDTDNRELYRIISGFPKYCISNRGRVMNILSEKNIYPLQEINMATYL